MLRKRLFGRALRIGIVLVAGLIAGCATRPLERDAFGGLPPRVELSDTPFLPQEQHQCGPASLATALVAAGHTVTPEGLRPQLYLPHREGSLQAEMIAAARRQGALALPAPSSLAGMLAEVAAGRPVIVLQNLGLSWAPRWHYAVVIGYDSPRGEILLRSGTVRREVMAVRTFQHTWARSENWAMVVVPAGTLPQSVQQSPLEDALAQLEKFADPMTMIDHYRAAIRRWPDSLVLGIGLGNALSVAGRQADAEQALRATLLMHPGSAVVLNNLASVLQMQQRLEEALVFAEQAVNAGGEWHEHSRRTRDEIHAAMVKTATIRQTPSPAAVSTDDRP